MFDEAWCIVGAMLLSGALWLFVTWRMWARRRFFDIAARCPTLNCVVGVSTLVTLEVLLSHWLVLKLEGGGLPCYAMLWTSYLGLVGTLGIPVVLRGMSLVISYEPTFRAKYARFATRRIILKFFAAGVLIVAVPAAVLDEILRDKFRRGHNGCFFLGDPEVLAIVGCFCCPVVACLRKVQSVQDAFKIRQELTVIVLSMSTYSSGQLVLILLINFKVIEDERPVHLLSEIMLMSLIVVTFTCSLLIPVAVHDRWCDIVSLRKRAVLPVDGASHGTVSLRNRAGRPVDGASWSVEILSPEAAVGEGVVLALARNTGIISEMFAKFCREHLCMESWNFIADIVRYEGVLEDKEQQWSILTYIVDEYLRPTSPQEVNIGSKMRKRVVALAKREVFMGLREIERQAALDGPLHEVGKMLQENLWNKFRLCRRTQRYLHQQLEIEEARAAGGDEEMLNFVADLEAMENSKSLHGCLFPAGPTGFTSSGAGGSRCTNSPSSIRLSNVVQPWVREHPSVKGPFVVAQQATEIVDVLRGQINLLGRRATHT